MTISIPYAGPLIDGIFSEEALAEAMTSPGRLCAAGDPDQWFPPEPVETSTNARAEYERTAQELCFGCPVRRECLILALLDESKPGIASSGIFGGTTPWQRKSMIRRQRRQARAVAA